MARDRRRNRSNRQWLLYGHILVWGAVAHGFVLGPSTYNNNNNNAAAVSQQPTRALDIIALSAVKKKKSKTKNRRPTSSSSSGGSGFGASPVATVPVGASGISGYSGSGTKVLRKAANNFDRIRKENEGNDVQRCCRDVYVRSPLNSATTYWFVGKIAREPSVDNSKSEKDTGDENNNDDLFFAQAAVAQKRLIFEYSKDQLRPQNMGGKYASTLELWLAPGDSEMDVATNKVNLTKVVGSASQLPPDWDPKAIGYNPEIYVGDEVTKGGLRVERDEHGVTTKAAFDVNQSM